jgi:5-carboxymethyl-2-hydroxymuconate isomerase
MPHLVILYTPNLDSRCDMGALCRALADTMIAQHDGDARAVFPVGGVRVLAYPAAHAAVADGGLQGRAVGGSGDYGFVYLNLRMGAGRSPEVHHAVGQALSAVAQAFFEPLMSDQAIGVTLQIDEGTEVFGAKHSSLHSLFL